MIPRRSAEPTSLTPVELRPFGQTGLHVSALGFGGANIGFTDISDKTLDRMFGAALELGVNLIDTAAMYGDSEEKIGRALHGRRQHYLICTKCGRCLPPRRSPNGFFMRLQRKFRRSRGLPEEYESLDWHPRVIEWSIHRSLRRLKTDHIDLLLLHSCSEETLQKEEVLGVLHRARKSGKVRFIGYSGDGPAALYAIQLETGRIEWRWAGRALRHSIRPVSSCRDLHKHSRPGRYRHGIAPCHPERYGSDCQAPAG